PAGGRRGGTGENDSPRGHRRPDAAVDQLDAGGTGAGVHGAAAFGSRGMAGGAEVSFFDSQSSHEIHLPGHRGRCSGVHGHWCRPQAGAGRRRRSRGLCLVVQRPRPVWLEDPAGRQWSLESAEWNTFEITLRGERLSVVLNGKRVIENAKLPGIPARGPIGLQHHGWFKDGRYKPASSLVQFRNISVRELPAP
ncbi:MAG: DUF1080 domain-containing protein, partial [Verrucomicrobia bacterium]|nr:DUF1080 domain-containing protein [Verrucomicrobiota bacterium]